MMNIRKYELWEEEARNDYEAAIILFKSKKFNLAVFHFCQAAEKHLKALLYLSKLQPWGHSLFNLLEDYEKMGNKVEDTIKIYAKELESHYFQSRYPDASPDNSPMHIYNEKLAIEIQEKSDKLIEFCKEQKEG